MNRTTAFVVVAVSALAAGLALGWAGRAGAATGKPALDVTFGPIQVDSGSRATFFLALRNTGTADAVFGAGDIVEIRYGTGGGAGDLVAADQKMIVAPLPTGVTSQPILDGANKEIGTRFSTQAGVTIAAGSAQVLLLDAPTASPGVAPVNISIKTSKTVGKAPKSLALTVVKTLPAASVDFYGDGADGALDVAVDAQIQTLRNYTDVLIRSGVTATVASGTTIRCTGRFENRGTIVVRQGSPGGGTLIETSNLSQQVYPPAVQAERGDSYGAPTAPAATNSQAVNGAKGGVGLGAAVFSLPLSQYRCGGGGGSGTLGAIGGSGGGLLRVLARGPIVNGGSILSPGGVATTNRLGAAGDAGGGAGGGAGGIVIFASGTSIDGEAPANANGPAATGVIDVSGAPGGTADPRGGGGGGGGGGLVIFCAPTVPTTGTMNMLAGLSSFQNLPGDVPTTETIWAGGGGGGACAGDGGDGSPVRAGGLIGPAAGADPAAPTQGQLVLRLADPRTLWR